MVVSDEQLIELVKRIVETAAPLRVILFGSTARGEAGSESDIDVLVVVPDGSHRRKTAQKIYRGLLVYGIPVDIVVATPSDLQMYGDSPGLIYKEAIRDGVELYAA
jgi:predicted nucleotidyltransferase